MIFLTGCVDASDELTYTHQVFNHGELLKSVTKASIKVVDGMVDVSIDKAVSISMDEQPGPVHVDVPISIASKEQLTGDASNKNSLSRKLSSRYSITAMVSSNSKFFV